MGVHRTRQSNRTEYCPVCDRVLTNRAAAVSHYRAHAQTGAVTPRTATSWYLPTLPGVWFQRGYEVPNVPTVEDIQQARAAYYWAIQYGKTGRGGHDF